MLQTQILLLKSNLFQGGGGRLLGLFHEIYEFIEAGKKILKIFMSSRSRSNRFGLAQAEFIWQIISPVD